MKDKLLQQDLRDELGDGGEMNYLAVLSPSAQRKLSEDIRVARKRQREALDDAINHGMRLVPALLRGPLKRILFP